MMATVGSSDGSLRSTASPRTRRRNGPRTYRFIRTSRHNSWTGKSSIATSGSTRPRPDTCRVPDDAASPPRARKERASATDEGQGAACPPSRAIRARKSRCSGTGLLDFADGQPAEVDVLRAVPAEGGDRTTPGDGHGGSAGAARARVAAVGTVIRHFVDL